jgi:hypothetical protein
VIRPRRFCIALSLLLGGVSNTHAGVEKSTVPCDDKMCLWERPLIAPVSAWRLDTDRSARVRTAIYVLNNDRGTQTEATAHVMTQAFARTAGLSLEDFIIAERDRLLGPSLDMQANEVAAIKDGAGNRLPAIEIAPRAGRSGAVQTVVFAQDGDYFVTLSYSAVSHEAQRTHWNDFTRFVAAYRADKTTGRAPSNKRAKR